jgi:hypothetical protein
MAQTHTTRPAPALAGNGPRTTDRLGSAISCDNTLSELQAQPGRLIDNCGHEHSEAIFRNWTPAAIKAMGIRRVGDEPKGGAE